MQISSKCKYYIYMLDAQLNISIKITGAEERKTNRKPKTTNSSVPLSVLTVTLALMISLPSGHRQTGRVGASIKTVNRTNISYP